ncbi:Phosphoglycerate kinase [Geodia barretti]|uniref:Phosphoglycerate kinase n=1 Tax=Geodia barretti TaxID=519541 RepID=A0AA35R5A3_GEOBA|nr:Phosphoglycerate kinase [Geodia barretti]
MAKRQLTQLDVAGKTVLVRVDFNVPIEQGVEIIAQYDQRLRATLPTIDYLLERDCKVVLCSHLGRPRGKVDEALRLFPVGDRLSVLLGRPVTSLSDCIGPDVASEVAAMESGQVYLLENLRFHEGEENNDDAFSTELAALADCFVMDAFAVAHRAHASTVGLPRMLPSAMGLLMQREVESLGLALTSPERPLAALMGGAKVSDKILVLENLLGNLDRLYIGGGMAVTFLAALGKPVGASPVEADRLDFAREVIDRANRGTIELHVPTDIVAASEFEPHPVESQTFPVDGVPDGWYIMDVGNATAQSFARGLADCKTIIWNGPMGVFEMERFSAGTRTVANAIAGLPNVTTVVGGGSTAEAVEALGLETSMTHVSTGGGASLEFLEGRELPGIAALPDA